MPSLSLYELWEKVVTKFVNTCGYADIKDSPNFFSPDIAEILNETIKKDLSLDNRPLTERTLIGYHEHYVKTKKVKNENERLKNENNKKDEPRKEPKDINLNAHSRYILEAYVRHLPKTVFSGSYVSYQFPIDGKKLEIKSDSGNIETFVATRMVWIVIPKTETECRVIGIGSNQRKYKGDGKFQGNVINVEVTDKDAPNRTMRFDVTNNEAILMEGHQTLFESKTAPSIRKMVWQRIDNEFVDLSDKEDCVPHFFQNTEDLPPDFQKYVSLATEDAPINPENNKPIEQETPQYVAEIDDLKAQNGTLQNEIAALQNKTATEVQEYRKEKGTLMQRIVALEIQLYNWKEATKIQLSDWKRATFGSIIMGLLLVVGTCIFSKQKMPSTTAVDSKQITWYMVTPWDGNTSNLCVKLRELTNRVKTQTHDSFRIMISNNMQMPDSGKTLSLKEIHSGVRTDDGLIQMVHSTKYHYSWTSTVPSAIFFSAIPFGMDYYETKNWIGDDNWLSKNSDDWGEGYRFWRQLSDSDGVIPFPCGHSGEQWGGWYKEPITKIEDFSGKKMRIAGLAGVVLKNVGAQTCYIPQYDLLSAMQSDTLFMAEWIDAIDDYNMGLYKAKQFKYVDESVWNEPNSMFEMTVNKKAFEVLSPRFQSVLVAAIQKMNDDTFGYFTNTTSDKIYRDRIAATGVKYFKLPKPVLDSLKNVTRRLLYEHVQRHKAQHPEIVKIYESYLKHCKKSDLSYKPPVK